MPIRTLFTLAKWSLSFFLEYYGSTLFSFAPTYRNRIVGAEAINSYQIALLTL